MIIKARTLGYRALGFRGLLHNIPGFSISGLRVEGRFVDLGLGLLFKFRSQAMQGHPYLQDLGS